MSPVSNPPTVPVSLTSPFCRWFFPRVKQRTKRSKRTTKQMTKAININNSRTRGPNRRLHEINFSWWDDIAKIESFQHFHHLKRKNTFYATLFFLLYLLTRFLFFPISYKERMTEVTGKYGKRCEYCKTMQKYTAMLYLDEHVLRSYQFAHETKLWKKKYRGQNEVLKTQSHSLSQPVFFWLPNTFWFFLILFSIIFFDCELGLTL